MANVPLFLWIEVRAQKSENNIFCGDWIYGYFPCQCDNTTCICFHLLILWSYFQWLQLMDVLGVRKEGDPWKTLRSRWNVAKMKIRERRALGNEGFWWRWRIEVELWYGRWLEEMKEKVSHVCSQNNRRVEWSQHKHSIRNFKS